MARVGFDFVALGSIAPLPSVLTAFRSQFPEAQVELQVLPRDQVERALLEDRLDIAFAFGSPNSAKLGSHHLLEGRYQVLLPEASALRRAASILPELLVNERLLPQLSAAAGEAKPDELSPSTGDLYWASLPYWVLWAMTEAVKGNKLCPTRRRADIQWNVMHLLCIGCIPG